MSYAYLNETHSTMLNPRIASNDVDGLDSDISPTSVGIQSVGIGMSLLSAIAREARPQGLADIARVCRVSPTKAHRYLVSLQRTGYVEREGGTGRYRLGVASVQLGLAAFAQLDFTRIASEWLPSICSDVQQTVFLALWGQNGPTIIRWEDTGQPIAVNVRVGSTMPLIRSATGRVFGANMPAAATDPFVKAELAASGKGQPVRSIKAAALLFEGVRQAGYSRASGSYMSNIGAVCVPVFGQAGKLAGAITSLGLLDSFPEEEEGQVVQGLLSWSRRLSARLGAPGTVNEVR